MMKHTSTVLMLCLSVTALRPLAAQQPTAKQNAGVGLSAETRQRLMESLQRGAAFLSQKQKPNGNWENHPGIDAMVATAILRQPGAERQKLLSSTGKALDALAKLAKPDGGIYEKDIPHYITAVSIMALVAGGRPQDRPLIEKGREYIAGHILDEGEGVPPTDKFYGGRGH